MTEPTSSTRDSQQQLAMSIARAVQLGLPAPDSEEAIRASVGEALRAEARGNECALARVRVAFFGILAALAAGALLFPAAFAFRSYGPGPLVVALAGAAAAGAFLVALHRGWYTARLRLLVPALDAAAVFAGALVHRASLDDAARETSTGFYAIVVAACALIAFSGAVRLSRRAARHATGAAVAAWVATALLAGTTSVALLLVALAVGATGYLGTRITRIIRRVVIDEVSRVRLTRLYQDAQEAIDAREEVLRIVSHDLRNPLGTIAMAADLLLDIPATEEQRTRQLGIIKRAGTRMHHLIRDLLDVARIESGRLPLEPEPCEVADLFDAVVEIMRPHAVEKEIELRAVLPDGLPPVHIDFDRIHQVFSNLIGNAIKFTPSGGLVTIRAERLGEKVRMTVADTGPGIPPGQLEEIFGRMWQARRDDQRGIGLGLTIAKSIVEAHGERIGVESRLGEGTEFWFTVPVAGR